MAAWGREVILRLAGDARVKAFVHRYGPLLGARRFVAGATPAEAVAAVRALNAQGMLATLDLLGEAVSDREGAAAATEAYVALLDAIAAADLDSTVSLKPTQIGIDLDADHARDNVARILDRAREHGNFVRLDMEDSSHTEATLRLYRALRRSGRDNVGIVVQSYLYRSLADLESLDDLAPNVRLVKGAYNEPPVVAFPHKADVDANLRRLIARQLERGFATAVATHDEGIIAVALETARRLSPPPERFEFQMLYGIRPVLQRRLVAQGQRLRIYVPFGPDWYPYLMRRLAERPANLAFVLRNLIRR